MTVVLFLTGIGTAVLDQGRMTNDERRIKLLSFVVGRSSKTAHPTSRMTNRDKLGIGLASMESARPCQGITTSPCVRRRMARTVASATCWLVQVTSRVIRAYLAASARRWKPVGAVPGQ